MTYFLGLSVLVFLVGAFVSGGLPTLFLSLIMSSVSEGYSASWVSGLIPARCTRRSTVLFGMPNFRAISDNVRPVITCIIGNITQYINSLNYATITKQPYSKTVKYFLLRASRYLTNCLFQSTLAGRATPRGFLSTGVVR